MTYSVHIVLICVSLFVIYFVSILFWIILICTSLFGAQKNLDEQLAQQAKEVDALKLIPTHNDLLSTYFG